MKKILKVPLFFHKIEVYQEPTLSEAIEKANLVIDKSDNGYNALTVYMRQGLIILLFKESSCTPGIVAHEANHAVNYIMKDIMQRPDLENDEFECYLLGWLVDELHKHLKVNTVLNK